MGLQGPPVCISDGLPGEAHAAGSQPQLGGEAWAQLQTAARARGCPGDSPAPGLTLRSHSLAVTLPLWASVSLSGKWVLQALPCSEDLGSLGPGLPRPYSHPAGRELLPC